ncbi:hypothetical protein GCM10010387_03400 [Streptomyces inusitatus]|uniref:Secreted protein n=1 Tax=Streptomyces inusitatus TaxID=68221 RepID=A0A918UJQ1_9ACTN|nr:hypothetical protein [Streptomyces inusitatus]GGZ14588.1 hypothetical protein GCM10010387_03400 [Streptomyces inusitatus]
MRTRNIVIAAVTSVCLTMGVGVVGAVTTAQANAKPASVSAEAARATHAVHAAPTAPPSKRKSKTKKIVGQVEYLAPGKIIVTPNGKTGQALWLAIDTKIKDRMGDLCFKDEPLPYTCTPDEFEETLKKLSYAPWVTVTHKDGVALTITSVVPV